MLDVQISSPFKLCLRRMPVKEENWIPLTCQESALMLAIHMPFTIFTLFLGVSIVIYNISVLLTILARKSITVSEKNGTVVIIGLIVRILL